MEPSADGQTDTFNVVIHGLTYLISPSNIIHDPTYRLRKTLITLLAIKYIQQIHFKLFTDLWNWLVIHLVMVILLS